MMDAVESKELYELFDAVFAALENERDQDNFLAVLDVLRTETDPEAKSVIRRWLRTQNVEV